MHQRRTRFRPAAVVFAVCLTMGVLDNWPSRFAGLLPVWVASQSADVTDSDSVTIASADATGKKVVRPARVVHSAPQRASVAEPRPTFDPLPRSVAGRPARIDAGRVRLAKATRERR